MWLSKTKSKFENVLYIFALIFGAKMARLVYQGFKTFILPRFVTRNFPREYGPWAVITGCTRGVGLWYAHELAKRRMNLVLVGRSLSKLQEVADFIQQENKVNVELVEFDFENCQDLTKTMEQRLAKKDIGVLVNNVGVILPYPMYFTEVSPLKSILQQA